MAATLTPDGELTYFSFPIEKSSETEEVNPVDGTPDLIVYGKATDGTVDSDLQIVDTEWSAKAIQDWLATGGNLRVQHQARRDPAGVGLDVNITPDGHFVKALVAEPSAKHLVRIGALKDFSIGVSLPDIRQDPTGKAMNGIITGRPDGMSKISEISLVDRGSNFNSKFQLVKAASNGAPEFVGKMFTTIDVEVNGSILSEDEFMKVIQEQTFKAATREDDNHTHLTIPDDVHVAFTPADLAKMLGRNGVAKRKMDPDVGGGVDRDKIPATDFAGRDRSFPIVTPGDVSDAASSIGRAGGDNFSSDQLKKNIIRIARRKGASFVAELPEAWKKELGMSKKAAESGDGDEGGTAVKGDENSLDVVKGGDSDGNDKDIVVKGDDSDDAKPVKPDVGGSKDEEDDDTGEDDDTEKSAVVEVEKTVGIDKKSKVLCPGCGANVHSEHKFCSECGGSLKDALAIKKNHDFTCLKCGMQLDKGEKYCPSCGKQHPGYLPEADSKVKAAAGGDGDDNGGFAPANQGDDGEAKKTVKVKKKTKKAARAEVVKDKPSPADGAEEAADTDPVPAHREPDGPAIEELEQDAGLPTTADSAAKLAEMLFPGDFEASASMRLKMLNVPLDYGMLHDLTCPCFHPDDVAKSYPRFDLTSLDAGHWQRKAFDMAASAPLDQARKASELWQNVVTLKNTDPRYVSEARSDLFKSFLDANPGPGSFPTPGAVSARSFNHPLVTDGHEAPSPGHGSPNTSPGTFGQISAAQYDRGPLTAGHGAISPSDQQGMMQPVSVPTTTGVPTRTYYTNAMRQNARQAMLAMHDHIAQTFPDLCPAYTTDGPYRSQDLPGSRPVPAGVGGPTPHGAAKVKKSRKKDKKHVVGIKSPKIVNPEVDKGATIALPPAGVPVPLEKAVTLDANAVQEMITKAVAAARAENETEVTALRKRLKKTTKALDAIASQPDPNGPYRGVAFDQIHKAATPEVLPSVARVEHAQQNLFAHYYEQFRTSPDPMQREVAWQEMNKMSGITHFK